MSVKFEALSCTCDFSGSGVLIREAYQVGGKKYDIKYEASTSELEKLKSMKPDQLITLLQKQMKAYLTASDALKAPDQTHFELDAENSVYAVKKGGDREDISDRTDKTTKKTMRVFAKAFRQAENKASTKPATETDESEEMDESEEESEVPTPPAAGKPPEAAKKSAAPAPTSSDPINNVKHIGSMTAAANTISGGTVALNGVLPASSWMSYATGIFTGFAVLKAGYDLCKERNLTNLLNFLSYLAMFIGSVLVLAGAFSNPITAGIVLVSLGIFSLATYVIANYDEIAARLKDMPVWQKTLYAVCFLAAPVINTVGFPGSLVVAGIAAAVPVIGESAAAAKAAAEAAKKRQQEELEKLAHKPAPAPAPASAS